MPSKHENHAVKSGKHHWFNNTNLTSQKLAQRVLLSSQTYLLAVASRSRDANYFLSVFRTYLTFTILKRVWMSKFSLTNGYCNSPLFKAFILTQFEVMIFEKLVGWLIESDWYIHKRCSNNHEMHCFLTEANTFPDLYLLHASQLESDDRPFIVHSPFCAEMISRFGRSLIFVVFAMARVPSQVQGILTELFLLLAVGAGHDCVDASSFKSLHRPLEWPILWRGRSGEDFTFWGPEGTSH